MPYLLLIMEDRDRRGNRSADGARQEYDRMLGFVEDLKRRGVYQASESLKPVSKAVRIAVRGGKRIVADGPVAESREHLVGYYLIEARDLDEVIGIAERVPAARFGAVEVRPVKRVDA